MFLYGKLLGADISVNYWEFTEFTLYYNAFRLRLRVFFMEIHHIVPKCMGGTDVRSNLIILSPSAHAIMSVLQSDFYNRPCIHRRQLKYLPLELLERGRHWLSQCAKAANAARKTTARSEECRAKMRVAALKPSAQPTHKKAAQSQAVSATNAKKQPCPHCGMLMNVGNLTKHLKGTRCKGTPQVG